MKFTVLSTRRIKSPDLARAGKDDQWVIYRTETDQVDSVTVPAETFNADTLTLAVRQHEEKKAQIVGRTLET
jgi:hypothetical protein